MNGESAYNRACFYAICGDPELSIEFLRLALKNKDTTIEWILSDSDLDLIREDERFQVLLDEYRGNLADEKNYLSASVEPGNNQLLQLLNNSLAR
jgi:hypothetical protein